MRITYILSILLVGMPLIFTACASTESTTISTPTQYTPKYSADQVIDVVKAQYPSCFKRERTGTDANGMFQYNTVDTPTLISVQFIGGSKGAWKFTVTCPSGYYLVHASSGAISLTGYFWESDGGLYNKFIP
jgi:hypothetical protein